MTEGERLIAAGAPDSPDLDPLVVAGQLVYTSFIDKGFQLLTSEGFEPDLGQVFLERIFIPLWNVYEPPPLDFKAVFVLTISEDSVLFGWIYNDGPDDLGRAHVPYCVCYLAYGPLTPLQFEQLLTCLERGPTAPLVNRWSAPAMPLPVVLHEPAFRLGVPLNEARRSEARATYLTSGVLWSPGRSNTYQAESVISTPPNTKRRRVMPILASVMVLLVFVSGLSWVSQAFHRDPPKSEQPSVRYSVLSGEQDCFVGNQPASNPSQIACTALEWRNAVGQVVSDNAGSVWAIAVDPQGKLLASTGNDGRIYLRRLSDGSLLSTLATPGRKRVQALSFRPDDPEELVAGGVGSIRIWRLDGRTSRQFAGITPTAWKLVWGKHSMLYSTGSDGAVHLWDIDKGRQIARTSAGKQPLFAGALSLDGQSFIAGSSDGRIRFWDARLQRITLQFKAHTGGVRTLAVDPKGRWLVSGSWDRTVKVWRMTDGHLVRVLGGHTDRVICAAISPDGAVLATAGRDRNVKLWDLQSGKLLNTLTGHRDWVLDLTFSPNGQTLISSSKDQTIHLWRKKHDK
ncbi:MAG: WD40 repeat domain-containing protein [Anaerolineae bacterium]|nr:WD40 repeat domain-containing protein [Gloeobacterales cyanobacterium ES-bin-313]